jgi:hypothetical protein
MVKKMLVIVAVLSVTLLAAAPAFSRGQTNVARAVQPAKTAAADAITIPGLLSYQGKLTDNSGNPVADTTYSVLFSLYAMPSGGSSFWSETQTVRTKAGLFSVLLGSESTIDSFPQAGVCYLGMKVGSDPEMTPRLRIASAAYAFLARKADTANYAVSSPITRPISPPIAGLEISKPCSLQASIGNPGTVLWVSNPATGSGVLVDTAGGYGVRVRRSTYTGLAVDSAGDNGLFVGTAGYAGVYVDRTGRGVTVNHCVDGLYIDSASTNGVRVNNAMTGLFVGSAANEGVHVANPGHDSLYIDVAPRHGVYIDHAGRAGMSIDRSDSTGVDVNRATYCGFKVDSARIGLYINQADEYGVYLNKRTSWGVYVSRAGNAGYWADSAGTGMRLQNIAYDGVDVDSAGWFGFRGWGNLAGGKFFAANPAGVGAYAHSYGNQSTDTAIYAYGKVVTTGGCSLADLKGGKEAQGVFASEQSIISAGTSRLAGGQSRVEYSAVFSENIRSDIPVSITVTPMGSPNGVLSVVSTDASGFSVTLKQVPGWSGDTDVEFSWIAVAALRSSATSSNAKAEWENEVRLRRDVHR